ncbi:UDP pyrophosphate phosphatase [Mycoplasmatota bacterium]|nr:UDP pyrophosphate phosphatase [Mycoplasmatota bacterium]
MDKLILLLKYIFFGAVQGITETLPISSSGHLVIFSELFNLEQGNDLTFEILLHFGSLIAIIYFYRKTICELIKNFFSYLFHREKNTYTDFKYVWLLVLATFPIGLIGFLFQDFIASRLKNLLTVGISLLVTALILYLISRMSKGNKEKENMTWKDALFIGIVQAAAIIPGISRSGSTVSASLSRKLDIDNALKFSFLLFIPAALGAMLLDIVHFIKEPTAPDLIIPYITAFLTSIVFTLISLNIFIGIIKKGKLSYFSIYCSIVGSLSIILHFFL